MTVVIGRKNSIGPEKILAVRKLSAYCQVALVKMSIGMNIDTSPPQSSPSTTSLGTAEKEPTPTGATASAPVETASRSTWQKLSKTAKTAVIIASAVAIGGIGFIAGLQTGKNSTVNGPGQMSNFGGDGSGYGRQMGPPSASENGQTPGDGFSNQSDDSSATTPQTTLN